MFSILLGLALFNEVPTVWTYIGGSLIVVGALINTFGKRSASK
ncbi:hypothetical protein JCM19235_5607 [Vibrio maritimus]|uniref:Metabolite transporter (DMT) superfamily n=1 Tax=Vibrio maritimus TaxID=990268 RepID=A0A090RR93_9VIBR|nr:hypothetical protein JCM19235_5607 [Vibrio maritimus]